MTGSTGIGPATDGWTPLDATDSMFACEADHVFHGLDLPELPALREAMAVLVPRAPALFARVDLDGRRWRPASAAELEEAPSSLLVPADPRAASPSDASTVQERHPLHDAPFRIVIGSSWLAIRASHTVLDGFSTLTLVESLIALAQGDEAPPVWLADGRQRNTMLTRYLVSHPPATAAAVRYQRRHRGVPQAPVRGTGPVRLMNTHASGPGPAGASLRHLRDRHWPTASVAAVALVGLRAALTAQGLAPRPAAEVLFDTRRYFPRARDVLGNWAVGVEVLPDDVESPESVTRCLSDTLRSGLPAAAMAGVRVLSVGEQRRMRRLGSVGGAERDAWTRVGMLPAPVGAPRLSFAFTPHHGPLSRLPWSPGVRPVVLRSCAPANREAMSVGVHELAGSTSISVTHDARTWDAAAVQSAVDALMTDPLEVLRSASTTRGPLPGPTR